MEVNLFQLSFTAEELRQIYVALLSYKHIVFPKEELKKTGRLLKRIEAELYGNKNETTPTESR